MAAIFVFQNKAKITFVQTLLPGDKLENFNYLNVAFISYKLTIWN